jgi:hypothetical protein
MSEYPEDSPRFLRAIRARELREKIAQAKARLGTMPSTEMLLRETHAQRSYRRAIQTIARVEKMLDAMK